MMLSATAAVIFLEHLMLKSVETRRSLPKDPEYKYWIQILARCILDAQIKLYLVIVIDCFLNLKIIFNPRFQTQTDVRKLPGKFYDQKS